MRPNYGTRIQRPRARKLAHLWPKCNTKRHKVQPLKHRQRSSGRPVARQRGALGGGSAPCVSSSRRSRRPDRLEPCWPATWSSACAGVTDSAKSQASLNRGLRCTGSCPGGAEMPLVARHLGSAPRRRPAQRPRPTVPPLLPVRRRRWPSALAVPPDRHRGPVARVRVRVPAKDRPLSPDRAGVAAQGSMLESGASAAGACTLACGNAKPPCWGQQGGLRLPGQDPFRTRTGPATRSGTPSDVLAQTTTLHEGRRLSAACASIPA